MNWAVLGLGIHSISESGAECRMLPWCGLGMSFSYMPDRQIGSFALMGFTEGLSDGAFAGFEAFLLKLHNLGIAASAP